MAEYAANAVQTIPPGETAIFNTVEACKFGLIRHRDQTGTFLLSGASNCKRRNAQYMVDFGANIAISEGGTAGPISVAISLDGSTLPMTEMIVTPSAVGEYFNVSRASEVDIWNGCCETIAVRNTSSQSIDMQNANIQINRKGVCNA